MGLRIEPYVERQRRSYRGAALAEKRSLIDEVVNVTGYHRKSVVRLLNKTPTLVQSRKRRRRPALYRRREVVKGVEVMWEASGRLGGRNLKAAIAKLLVSLQKNKELAWLDGEARELLVRASPATLDRLLKPLRRERRRARPDRRPLSFLRQAIAVKTTAEWDGALPGFLEIDLVAHAGGSAAGFHLWTLSAVDVASGWLELEALWGKDQQTVLAGIQAIRSRLPTTLRGLDCDNGSEFMNHRLFSYCRSEGVLLTRGRPYCKNDGAHIEQKNGAVVRQLTGHERFESRRAHQQLQVMYELVRLQSNFFQPTRKLLSKNQQNGRQHRTYDEPGLPMSGCDRRGRSATAE